MGTSRLLRVGMATALVLGVAACGGDDDDDTGAAAEPTKSGTDGSEEKTKPAEPEPLPMLEITATDYAFDVPAPFAGGLVSMSLVNKGKEAHFAAFAKPAEGKTTEDVRAALMTPPGSAPAGPPPLVEFAALGTVEPGGTSRMTMNLPAGPYVLFCALPAPDGAPHLAKGMLADVEVASGPARSLPETDGEVRVADFVFSAVPDLVAGENTVTLVNRGKQIHEIDLVEIPEGKTIEDLAAWAAKIEGPPPARFLGGPAVKADLSATTTFDLEAGVQYAFVCIIPDSLSDFAPHITKGMHSPIFTVEEAGS